MDDHLQPFLARIALLLYVFISQGSASPIAARSVSFSSIIAFGDSYTDNGNGAFRISNGTWPSNPAYDHGRFSNGLEWVEHVAANLSIPLHDYAVGGATTSNKLVQGYTGPNSTIPVPSVDVQIKDFISDPPAAATFSTALFVVFAGANDIFFDPNVTATQSVQTIVSDIEELQKHGAESFLLLNYPDLSQLPYDSYLNAANKTLLHSYSLELGILLQALSDQISNVAYVDLLPLFANFDYYEDPTSYGFSALGAYGSCLTGAYEETPEVTLCDDPHQHVFWDEYHPTGHSHQLIAQEVLKTIRGPFG